MTRFGEISSLWQYFKIISQFLRGYFAFGKILNLLWQTLYAFYGPIFIVSNGQILKTLFCHLVTLDLSKLS